MRGCWIEQKFCICGPDRKFGPARPRAARHYTTPAGVCQQVKMHKKSGSIEPDFVGFAYRHFDDFGLLFAIKSVISDKLAYALVLPSLAGLVLISQSVILGERERKVIDELTAGWHGEVWAFLITAIMFLAAAVKVVCRAYLENKIAVPVDIVTDI